MAASLLIVMPWTEYAWHFDRFLKGGQDFELSLLAVFVFLCLVVVLLQQVRTGLYSRLQRREWILATHRAIPMMMTAPQAANAEIFAGPLILFESKACPFPLQV